jgi:hypothetical protein
MRSDLSGRQAGAFDCEQQPAAHDLSVGAA